ncbi:hypothetical protein ABK040_003446 [Willaertia magna]
MSESIFISQYRTVSEKAIQWIDGMVLDVKNEKRENKLSLSELYKYFEKYLKEDENLSNLKQNNMLNKIFLNLSGMKKEISVNEEETHYSTMLIFPLIETFSLNLEDKQNVNLEFTKLQIILMCQPDLKQFKIPPFQIGSSFKVNIKKDNEIHNDFTLLYHYPYYYDNLFVMAKVVDAGESYVKDFNFLQELFTDPNEEEYYEEDENYEDNDDLGEEEN